MRFRRLFPGTIAALASLLMACEDSAPPVRLDFVGNTNLTSSDRTLNAADTFRTHVFAAARANGPALKRLKISVTYSPGPEPIVYPPLLSSFSPGNAPPDLTLTMLDRALTGPDYLFTPTFGARSTSGTERWTYTVTDAAGQSNTRAHRLTVRKADSAAVYQSYNLVVALPANERARAYFALHSGLLLPRFAIEDQANNQALIDLVAVNTNGVISLQAPQVAPLPNTWAGTKRTTGLRRSTLRVRDFGTVVTAAGLAAAYRNAPIAADSLRFGPLADTVVLAFRTQDGRYGLLNIGKPTLTPFPVFNCGVRMQK